MRSSSRTVLPGLIALAFAVRVGAFFGLGYHVRPEVWEAETVADNLLNGNGFTYSYFGAVYRSYMEPLYPALCAAVYHLTDHSAPALGIVHAALGALLVWPVFLCARRLGTESDAALAGLMTALHPGLVLYSVKFHQFVLDSALFAAVLAACLAFPTGRRWRSAVILGGLLGLAVLARPTVAACAPALLWWIWSRSSDSARVRAARVALAGACAALIVGPWVVRNYRIHGRFILTRSGTGTVFWLGNNPHAFTGSALLPSGRPIITDGVPAEVRDRLRSLDELGQQDYLRAQAVRFIRERPGQFLRRWAVKLGHFWWFGPTAGSLHPPGWLAAYKLVYLGLLAATAFGLWAGRRELLRDQGGGLLILGCCLAVSLLQSVFYVEGRHRLGIEPFLLILAAQGLRRAFERIRGFRPLSFLPRSN